MVAVATGAVLLEGSGRARDSSDSRSAEDALDCIGAA